MIIFFVGFLLGFIVILMGIDEGEVLGYLGYIIFLYENVLVFINEWLLLLLEFIVDLKFKIVLLNCIWILNMCYE